MFRRKSAAIQSFPSQVQSPLGIICLMRVTSQPYRVQQIFTFGAVLEDTPRIRQCVFVHDRSCLVEQTALRDDWHSSRAAVLTATRKDESM